MGDTTTNQALSSKTEPPVKKRAAGLYTIIAIKLGKGLLLLGVSLGIYSLMGDDLREEFERFLRFVNLDPETQFFAALGMRLQGITSTNLGWLASGGLLYAALLFCESIGMMFRAYWAAWLAIGETAFFIPIEVLDLLQRGFTNVIGLILIVNMLIVVYLARNRNWLFHHHH